MEAGYGHFVCSFWRLMEGDKTNKRQNEISFLRFGDLYNATKRTNDKTKWPQNLILSRCRSVVWRLVDVDKTNKRQNEQVTTENQTLIFRGNVVVLSFRRAVGKATKRTNEEMKFWYFVFAFVRFGALTKATKRTNEEMRFHFFILATCTTRQNEQAKKWNFDISFSRLFVLAPWPTRQNEKTRKWNSISSFWRLVQRDKRNKRRNEILFWRSVVCSRKEIVSDSLQSINFKVQR